VPLDEAQPGSAVDLSSGAIRQRCAHYLPHLRLAALLHDVGHGPLSHLFAPFAPPAGAFLDMVAADRRTRHLAGSLTRCLAGKERVPHEIVSCYVAAVIMSDLGMPEEDIGVVCSLISRDTVTRISQASGDEAYIPPLLTDMLTGAAVGCDRMDYLLRDSLFCGVACGTHDLNRLLKSLLPYLELEGRCLRLGLKESGLFAVENFLQARYQMLVQICGHKTHRACQAMLDRLSSSQLRDDILSCDERFLPRLTQLTDNGFVSTLLDLLVEPEDRRLLACLRTRKLVKRLVEVVSRDAVQGERTISHVKEQLLVRFSRVPERHLYETQVLSGSQSGVGGRNRSPVKGCKWHV